MRNVLTERRKVFQLSHCSDVAIFVFYFWSFETFEMNFFKKKLLNGLLLSVNHFWNKLIRVMDDASGHFSSQVPVWFFSPSNSSMRLDEMLKWFCCAALYVSHGRSGWWRTPHIMISGAQMARVSITVPITSTAHANTWIHSVNFWMHQGWIESVEGRMTGKVKRRVQSGPLNEWIIFERPTGCPVSSGGEATVLERFRWANGRQDCI